jgi:hypothetical protein
MVVKPPIKKLSPKAKTLSSFFSKVANDNRPPKKIFLGLALFVAGFLLIFGALFLV